MVVETSHRGNWQSSKVYLPEYKKNQLSLADLTLWQSLVGQYFYFHEDPTGQDMHHNQLWLLGDVILDLGDLGNSQLMFVRAKTQDQGIQKAWCDWDCPYFDVVTEFSIEDKKWLLEHLGFVPKGWKR